MLIIVGLPFTSLVFRRVYSALLDMGVIISVPRSSRIAAVKFLLLESLKSGGGGIIAHGIALFGDRAGDAGGEICLAETRSAAEQEI